MAQTPRTWDDYVGDGVEDTYQVTFPYQKAQEVFVTVDGDPVEFTFISEGWVQLAAAPANGAAIRIQRSTEAYEPRHEFANGVPLLPRFIDENNKQFLYVVQEAVNETAGTAADALGTAEEARDIAQAASDKVDAAVIDSALVLRQELAASSGAALTGYRSRNVERRLADMFSVADYGAEIGAMGYNPAADAQGIADSDPAVDTLKYGHLGVAKEVYGIRRNACALSVRAGKRGDRGFDPQVTGVNDTQGLANYGSHDVVGIFSDIISHPYESWEVIPSSGLTYQADGFTAPGLDFSRMRVGMVIKTDHDTPWWALISGFDQPANKVRVIEWRQAGGNSAGTPADGTGLKINPVTKQWALNSNLLFLPDSRAKLGVVAEYGVVNHSNTTGSGINGIDMIVLPQSTYGGEAAFLSRAPGAAKWNLGFVAQESSIAGFSSSGSTRGFVSSGSDKQGFIAVSSPEMRPDRPAFACRSGDLFGRQQMLIAADGRVWRMPFRTIPITDGMVMSMSFFRYIYGGSGSVTLSLPSLSETSLQDGDTLQIFKTSSASTITLSGNGRNIVADSPPSESVVLTEHRVYTVVYINNVWYIA